MDLTPRLVALYKSRLGLPLTVEEEKLVEGAARPRIKAYTLTRYKLRLGIPLTAQDKEVVREYMAKYQPCKASIHVRPETKGKWEAQASAAGQGLSAWIFERVQMSQRDHAPEVDALAREKRGLQEEVQTLRRALAESSLENGRLQERFRALEDRSLESLGNTMLRKGVHA